MSRSVVLLSGGLDSTVSLAHALKASEVELCLTFDYGQRSAAQEKKAAAALAQYYRLEHRIIELPFLREITSTSLIDLNTALPEPEAAGLDDFTAASFNAAAVWVPNRNGIFINIAAAYAESRQCELVITGFNREEAVAFPDNSLEFVTAASNALNFSTLNKVKVISYTQHLNKLEIMNLGIKLGVPFEYIWSCYKGTEKMCGKCESCLRFKRAAEHVGLNTESLFL
ncbi:MAG: 7-cyano-7-deazaguanine synthase QueC [Pelotomaculum sp.]|jgi:7-cyano-7-deazaguanine synthase